MDELKHMDILTKMDLGTVADINKGGVKIRLFRHLQEPETRENYARVFRDLFYFVLNYVHDPVSEYK